MTADPTTHEGFVHTVRATVLAKRADAIAAIPAAADLDVATRIAHCKLIYGTGAGGGYRGCCFYHAWQNGIGDVEVVEIASVGEESWVQLAGTTIHELAHVAAGHTAGHSADWKDWCDVLGLRRALAAGTVYRLAQLDPSIRSAIASAALLVADGSPSWRMAGSAPTAPRPCSAGVGTRGGKSRGKGSGSRMRLYECSCNPPVKIRAARDDLRCTCDDCGSAFTRGEVSA